MTLLQSHMRLWQNTAMRAIGQDTKPVAVTDKGDRRFTSAEWEERAAFDFIRQSYLITSRWLVDTMSDIEGLSTEDAHKVRFHTKQITDALSPSNFLLSNPEVIRETVESRGQNLVRGVKNLARDIKAGGGVLKMPLTDEKCVRVRREHRNHPGQDRLSKRPDPAYSV